jgi:hypothetical protein
MDILPLPDAAAVPVASIIGFACHLKTDFRGNPFSGL